MKNQNAPCVALGSSQHTLEHEAFAVRTQEEGDRVRERDVLEKSHYEAETENQEILEIEKANVNEKAAKTEKEPR